MSDPHEFCEHGHPRHSCPITGHAPSPEPFFVWVPGPVGPVVYRASGSEERPTSRTEERRPRAEAVAEMREVMDAIGEDIARTEERREVRCRGCDKTPCDEVKHEDPDYGFAAPARPAERMSDALMRARAEADELRRALNAAHDELESLRGSYASLQGAKRSLAAEAKLVLPLREKLKAAREALEYVQHHLEHGGLHGPWGELAKHRLGADLARMQEDA